jgi:hypothetical protein
MSACALCSTVIARRSLQPFEQLGGPETQATTHEITGGVNYYIKSHSAKLTFDATWLPNGTPVASDSGGILAQPNGENEFVFRGQFQLLL